AEDHANAKALGEALAAMDAVDLDPATVETNIVIFRVDERAYSVDAFLQLLREAGVLAVRFGPSLVRMVTHLDVNADDIERVDEVFADLKPR
ncbi:MAG: low specificity L-threonine aldolase, partial [Candidatus Krumholzibacteria bacterium]|nr:low specificity L-threonine aldolase [Candidatus Krumholzibacteria bacterium]